MRNRFCQRGLTTVEFSVSGVAFFLVLLGAIEVSRLLFTWNTLDATAQRAARLAAVCPPYHSKITEVAAFGSVGSGVSVLPDFTSGNLQLTYLNDAFADTGGSLSSTFVRVQIVNYQINLAIPFINNTTLTSPSFTAVVPAESLGYIPDGGGSRSCFGSA